MASPILAIVAADKGGVGKTTVTRLLLDYCTKQGMPARAFDTEPGEGVLRRFHPEAEPLAVETVPGQVRMIDSATSEPITVVDARAGMLSPIIKAFDRIKLMEDVRNGVMRLLLLHVIGPNVASMSEVARMGGELDGAKIVRILNHTNPDASFAPSLDAGVAVPYLDEMATAAVDGAGVPFWKFATDPTRPRVLRGYVRAWEDDVHAGFDRAGIGAMLRG